MARFGAIGNKGSASVQGVLNLNCAAANMRRFKLYDVTFGSNATPGDNVFNHIIQRIATAGTGSTAKGVVSLDPADSVTGLTATDTITVDATLTTNAILKNVALNQRATYRWVAAPYGEILVPAVANNGVMLGLSAASTTTFSDDAHIEEY